MCCILRHVGDTSEEAGDTKPDGEAREEVCDPHCVAVKKVCVSPIASAGNGRESGENG